jgi:nucleoside-diphosphate-sugar epimerase
VYGPLEAEGRLVPDVIRAVLRDKPIELTSGRQQRDFVYVADVVEGFIAAAIAPDVLREAFNLCSGEAVAVSEVVTTVLELMGSDQTPVFGARAYRAADTPVLSGDPGKAELRLGWKARASLREGLAQTISWHAQDELLCGAGERMGGRGV